MPCKRTPKQMTDAQHREALRRHLALEAGLNAEDVDDSDADARTLLTPLLAAILNEDEDGAVYLSALDVEDAQQNAEFAKGHGWITMRKAGSNYLVELTSEGRKVLAETGHSAKKTSRKTTTDNTPNQEDAVSKDKKTKSKPAKVAKAKGERTPNANSHRWVAIEAMKANPGATRDQIAAICIKANGGDAAVWAKRIARARRFAKRTNLALPALGKATKAEKPVAKKAKADKPKASKPKAAKKAAAAGGDPILG